MKDIFLESGFMSLNKQGEELCGDRVMTINDETMSQLFFPTGSAAV